MEQLGRHNFTMLDRLYVMLDAGERGYEVAAANVNNPGLKVLFKIYARQRAEFKEGLRPWIEKRGLTLHSLIGLAAKIHRGRINIFAALTIGEWQREQVVMKEVLTGERAALRAYERALNEPLPADILRLVKKQHEQVQRIVERVQLMRRTNGRQLVVGLFDTQRDAAHATEALRQTNFDSIRLEKISTEKKASSDKESGRISLFGTILSGAVGGAMWGSVTGTLSGFGVLHLPGLGLQQAPLSMQEFVWAETALSSIFAGAFVGGMLGTFIGWGIQGGAASLYEQSKEHSQVLVELETQPDRAIQAVHIMSQIGREA